MDMCTSACTYMCLYVCACLCVCDTNKRDWYSDTKMQRQKLRGKRREVIKTNTRIKKKKSLELADVRTINCKSVLTVT